MPLISHEIPKALFNRHDEVSDYPYVLGHLLSLDTEYADFYKEKLKTAEYSILDNSAFELGKSIPMEELYELGKEYNPTHLVLPDVVNNHKQTLDNAKEYLANFKVEGQQYIGVCQGDTFEEIADCIDYYLRERVDIIALPFDLVEKSDYVTVRFRFLNWWYDNRFNMGIGKPKFHLLGCQNPVEFILINSLNIVLRNLIYSLDTSSPVINGWEGNKLGPHGLIEPKPKVKLADNLDIKLSENQIDLIFRNIKTFRSYVS
jgi:hypothetical protein